MFLVALLALFSARLAGVMWWVLDPNRWDQAFNGYLVWPVLGIIALPWTTLMWVLVAPTGNIAGFDWLLLTFAFIGDVVSYGSGYTNRSQVPGYSP